MKILFIQTGGTIDKDYPKITKGYSFEIEDPAIERTLKRLNPSFDFEVISAFKKDSLDISEKDRQQLKTIIEKSDVSRIVITHGTDTMRETATFLKDIPKKSIVITGSMRPERFSNSDADINIGLAIAAVQTVTCGVYICMNGLVIPSDKLERDMKTGKYFLA